MPAIEVIRRPEGVEVRRDGACLVLFPGEDASEAFRYAVNYLPGEGGRIAVGEGTFRLSEPIRLDKIVTFEGSGLGTRLVPPPDDFALRVGASRRSPLRREIIRDASPWLHAMENRTYGLIVRDLAIDGMGTGRGMSVEFLIEGAFSNLFIHRTRDGAGIRLGPSVMETTFRNVHLLDCGTAEEAAISIEAQSNGDASNNVLFDAVYIIFPNGSAMEVGAGSGAQRPRLITLSDCMMHGWLPRERAAEAPLLKVKSIDPMRGLRLRGGRITCTGSTMPYVAIMAGQAVLQGVSFGGGGASCAIMTKPGTDVLVRDCAFHSSHGEGRPGDLAHVGGIFMFDSNLCHADTGRLVFGDCAYGVVTGNRFMSGRRVLLAHGEVPEERLRLSGNILRQGSLDETGLLRAGNILLPD